jgi:hypothetical protein
MGNINKTKNVKRSIDLTPKTMNQLNTIASKRGIHTSVLIREYIDQGMTIEKSKDDIDFIRKQIREELESVMDKHMNRIIKLLIKIGVPACAMMFFTSQLLYSFVKEHIEKSYDTMLNDARKKAATYLNLKSEIVNESYDNLMKD